MSKETPQYVHPNRTKLPDTREGITHKFTVAGHEGYITANSFENGRLCEIFLVMNKEGSVISGFADAFATAVSIALQYGVPLNVFMEKFIGSRFEPMGRTNNPEVQEALSLVDYIFRWLQLRFTISPELTEKVE